MAAELLANLLRLVLFVSFVSSFSFAAFFAQQDGHLLSFYRKALERLQERHSYWGRLAKPLGLCPVCFSFWVGMITLEINPFCGRYDWVGLFLSCYVVYKMVSGGRG